MQDDLPQISTVDVASACGNILGEGPIWVSEENALYWVDIQKPAIWRCCSTDHLVDHWTPPFRITAIVPRASGGLFGAGDKGFVSISVEDNHYEVFGRPEQENAGNRFNDGAVDRMGRFWVGSMDDAEQAASGQIYRVGPDLHWEPLDTGFRVPNGPAFSPDGQSAYLADSAKGIIHRYLIEPDGEIASREVFLTIPPEQGFPDGMATDANGCLWVAFWDGAAVRCFNPDGTQLHHIALPVSRPTSCAFGGVALDQLFITSARIGLSPEQLEAQPMAGSLFCLTPGVHGWPLPAFAG